MGYPEAFPQGQVFSSSLLLSLAALMKTSVESLREDTDGKNMEYAAPLRG